VAQKATHYGTCQVCGRVQRLPGSLLSKHGYTVKWSVFTGVCWGAEHQPFEQSKDLIDGAIERAEAEAAELEAEALRLEQDHNPQVVYAHIYHAATWQHRHSWYEWRAVPVAELTIQQHVVDDYEWVTVEYPYKEDRGHDTEVEISTDGRLKTAAEHCHNYNQQYAKHQRQRAARLHEYATWQSTRIKDWQPKELTPVKAA
jgi:hypothetical protein